MCNYVVLLALYFAVLHVPLAPIYAFCVACLKELLS